MGLIENEPNVRFRWKAVIRKRPLSSVCGHLKNHGLGALLTVNNGNFYNGYQFSYDD